jgi:hypothetical protein
VEEAHRHEHGLSAIFAIIQMTAMIIFAMPITVQSSE